MDPWNLDKFAAENYGPSLHIIIDILQRRENESMKMNLSRDTIFNEIILLQIYY